MAKDSKRVASRDRLLTLMCSRMVPGRRYQGASLVLHHLTPDFNSSDIGRVAKAAGSVSFNAVLNQRGIFLGRYKDKALWMYAPPGQGW